ncbi:hypothetical protein MPTK1_6g12140 [Marchantia polymorpha subsp. ruderalis]|uniref:Uncharacterized protein n=3 Tax=Marchantia polymorpha TaxID=3197 RepID=A0A176VPG1_MARPO|nr:hypothetical protein AXG93_1275s1370 [Marchantia polymorpha subsp. ruderalis]PTQ29738.1 hypothetical protein MARPO_0135s0022 [Marchantia polymorpha]PTQ29739.1 hypothetical protein MARPO_0135s0022 [Marchantia polymorpha]BBN14485.1 hypothetical protein Mp_6g12140 [Marchantia polymorpha subsp. ruderalis]BBN14486.1 hypothetical protein Mp_6g12140 [Marchantia polymorpha subsp. ruderalis]|eukprot:PTQ29738.1 hypothetical protein MARPO_0135s0022 [Marchantia polymorpha]
MACAILPVNAICSRIAHPPLGASSSAEFFGGSVTRFACSGRKWSTCAVSSASVVCSGVKATTSSDPLTAEKLQEKFGRQGVRFVDVAGTPATELKLRNGSSARMLISGAQITSYKANMWHGAQEELLHSVRSDSGNSTSTSIRGGIVLSFSQLKDPLSSILPSSSSPWRVEAVECQPSEYAQMTLTNYSYPEVGVGLSPRGSLQFKYVVTLFDDSLSVALVVSNTGSVPVDFTGSIISHLGVSSAGGAFAVGLKGYRYRSLGKQKQSGFDASKILSQIWKPWGAPDGNRGTLVEEKSGRDARQELEDGKWTVESEDYSQLQAGMDRLYTTPPESFSIMDRGKRRSLVVERHGFTEFCLSNPGPDSQLRDWNKFVCVGPTQSCQSVRLYENREWRGAVTLLNPGTSDGEPIQ